MLHLLINADSTYLRFQNVGLVLTDPPYGLNERWNGGNFNSLYVLLFPFSPNDPPLGITGHNLLIMWQTGQASSDTSSFHPVMKSSDSAALTVPKL